MKMAAEGGLLEMIDQVAREKGLDRKVLIETKQGGNLLYLPLDKLLQQGADPAASFAPQPLMQGPSSSSSVDGASTGSLNDARSRANQRSRERETR